MEIRTRRSLDSFSGPNVFICSECVELCVQILADPVASEDPAVKPFPRGWLEFGRNESGAGLDALTQLARELQERIGGRNVSVRFDRWGRTLRAAATPRRGENVVVEREL